MGETVAAVILLLLAVYGCVHGIRRLMLWLMYPSSIRSGAWVIPLKGHREDTEFLVRCLSTYRAWGALPLKEIYIVDVGADPETVELAQCASKMVGTVTFVPNENRANFLADFFENTEK